MGYSTDFDGGIATTPSLTEDDASWLDDFFKERHDNEGPAIWCDLEVDYNESTIIWNGSEKSYDMDKWLVYLIKIFFGPRGYVLNGEMSAQGDDPDDMWIIYVENNVVSKEDLVTTPVGNREIVGEQ